MAGMNGNVRACRSGARLAQGCCSEDPWISARHHSAEIVYSESGYGGLNMGDALNFGGANVWINSVYTSSIGDTGR